MEYIFKINFNTDGDFYFKFVPRGMKYDGEENYYYEKVYTKYNDAISEVKEICAFLKEHVDGIDYTVENVKEYIDSFLKTTEKNNANDIFYIDVPMYGNYEGTEFIFRVVPKKVSFDFYLTEEEEKLFNKNAHEVTYGDIKRAVMELFRDNE